MNSINYEFPIKIGNFVNFYKRFNIYILDATIYVGGLDEKVSETLLWELFVQAGPVGKLSLLSLLHSVTNF